MYTLLMIWLCRNTR